VTAKKEQALSITFSQSDWFIFSLHDMLASAPLSGLSFTTGNQPIRKRNLFMMSFTVLKNVLERYYLQIKLLLS
jgi:hypothetical protein